MTPKQSKLGDYVLPVRNVNPVALLGDSDFTYVDISSVNRELRAITNPQVVAANEAPSRARQETTEDDVIVSTVRPNLNTVAIVTGEYAGAIASTGFCVLRAVPSNLDARFLFHWISSEATVKTLVGLATGATYPAVSDKAIKSLPFAPPPILEQKRIATILDKAGSLRRKRQEAIRLADEFVQATFFYSFGDADTNQRAWPLVRLEEIALQITDGEHQTPRRSSEGVYLLSARNIQNGWLALKDVDYVPKEEFERIRRRCEPKRGDILISCSGSIGRVAQVATDDPLALVRSVALVRPDTHKVRSCFLEYFLRSSPMQRRMVAASKSSAQANLFQGPIRALPVMLPPIEDQVRFEQIVARVSMLSERSAAAVDELTALSKSLQSKLLHSGLVQ